MMIEMANGKPTLDYATPRRWQVTRAVLADFPDDDCRLVLHRYIST